MGPSSLVPQSPLQPLVPWWIQGDLVVLKKVIINIIVRTSLHYYEGSTEQCHTFFKYKCNRYLHISFVIFVASWVCRGEPAPSLLRAVTLKKYSLSMSRSGTVYDVCAGFRSATFFQAVRRLSRTSRRYPVRGRPPSLSGGFQETLAVFSVTSETARGPTGVDGLPTSVKQFSIGHN